MPPAARPPHNPLIRPSGLRNARLPGAAGVDIWLIFRLARRPIWLAGMASMILGFAFQLAALHFGALALVQPILALELLFVFGCADATISV
jgi:hypothetical protein